MCVQATCIKVDCECTEGSREADGEPTKEPAGEAGGLFRNALPNELALKRLPPLTDNASIRSEAVEEPLSSSV